MADPLVGAAVPNPAVHPIQGATMPADQRRRPTTLAAAFIAGLVALASATPAHATFPARNGLIAFYSDTDQGAQIFTVRPNGRDLRQITHVNGDAINVDWSPDGRLIAFDIETADSAQLAIMHADGSGLVTLPKAPATSTRRTQRSRPTAAASSSAPSTGEVEGLWSMKL